MTRTLRLITSLLAFQLFARGLDYITGNPNTGAGVFQVESLNPPIVWGAVCILASLMVAIGVATGRNRITRDGAVLTSAVYLVFAVMVAGDIHLSPPDDWRFFTSYLCSSGVWATIAFALTVRMAVVANRKEHDG